MKDDKSKEASVTVRSCRVASSRVAFVLPRVRREIDEIIGAEKLTEYLPLMLTTFHRRNVFVVLRRNLRSLRPAAALTFRERDVATGSRHRSRETSFDERIIRR